MRKVLSNPLNYEIIEIEEKEAFTNIEEQVKITNSKFITKQLNKIIHNILTHTNLDNSLDFLWDFIPEDEKELLKFFNEYYFKKRKRARYKRQHYKHFYLR